ncbi:MAG: efflux RND transporter periplasmic adaptor subunit [Candidatus Obscuribacterales bacterium]|nr:efflux RND transporter periplasmic adaptor subunit [Candidatus Obscuribacterales bacterium]
MFKTYKQAIFICAGLIVLAVMSWVIAAFSLQSNQEAEQKSDEKTENFIEVSNDVANEIAIRNEPIDQRKVSLTLRITGQIRPEVGKEVDINSRFSGRVIKVPVALGQKVSPGEVLATIDSREIGDLQAELIEARSKLEIARAHERREQQIYEEQLQRPAALIHAKAEFNQANTKLELSESEYRRQEQLHQEKIASTKEFLRSKAGYENAKADFSQAQQSLQREEHLFANRAMMRRDVDVAKAETKRADQHLSTLKQRLVFLGVPQSMVEDVIRQGKIQVLVPLISPANGVVTNIDVAVGEVLSPEKVAFTVTNLSSVVVAADLPEIDLARVKMDSPVRVKISSYPNEIFHGTINYISQVVDPETRTVKIRVTLPNESNRLKSNMFAVIDIDGDSADMLACPKSAIQERDGNKVVYVAVDGGYQERAIKTGRESETYVEVLSGLAPGEKVATQGSLMLKTELTYRH